MTIETKEMIVPFEIKEIQEEDEFFRVKGLGSTFGNVDLGGDIAVQGCFRDSISELKRNARPIQSLPNASKIIPMLWQHDMDNPVGSFIKVDETTQGLEMEAILPKSDTFVSGRVIPQMKVGSVGELSIGYIPEKTKFNDDGHRELIKVQLIETSLVTMAMNPKAVVTDMKGKSQFQDLPLASRDHKWDDNAVSDNKRAYLWSDDEQKELPIGNVVDGEIKAVPDAIFKAAAVLRSARNDIPDSDRAHVIKHIEQYYDKLGLDSPFTDSKSFRVDDLDVLDEKTLETLLNRGIVLSRKNAKRIVAALRAVKREADRPDERDAGIADLVASMKSFNQSITEGV